MGHYGLHATSVPWQDPLLYAALILAAIVCGWFARTQWRAFRAK